MDVKLIVKLIGLLSILCAVRGAPKKTDEGELAVILEFIEFELEDICVERSDAEWNYLNGTDPDLKKVRTTCFVYTRLVARTRRIEE